MLLCIKTFIYGPIEKGPGRLTMQEVVGSNPGLVATSFMPDNDILVSIELPNANSVVQW